MAKLMKCLACDGAVSDMATACVHCGQPFESKRMSIAGMGRAVLFWAYTVASGVAIVSYAIDGRATLVEFYLWILTILAGSIALSIHNAAGISDVSANKKENLRS